MPDPLLSKPPLKFAVSLAVVGALGPAAVDMYLPSLPEMARDLATGHASIQLTLTVFLFAMGFGQLLFGPCVDAWGRRGPLIAGLLLFSGSAFGAALASSLEALLLARGLQGLGSALTLVVIMSMVRDVSQGVQAAKLFALLMTIEGVAPIIAPAVGGFIDGQAGWRGVLFTLAVLGVLVTINSLLSLKETLPAERREPLNIPMIARTYARIASDRQFLLPTLAVSAVFFFLFAYIAGATFVYQSVYQLPAAQFGFLFGTTGVAILLGAMLAGRLVSCHGLGRMSIIGVSCILLGACLALISAMVGAGLIGIVAGMAIALLGLGIAETTLMSLVMSSQKKSLGSTAALLGAFQLGISACATPISGLLSSFGAEAWCGLLVASAATAWLLTALSVRRAAAVHSLSVSH
ncbi:multidrug effflux MFS transporter [Pseudomonas kribbensis]|uniref:Bcr/CflA family efflux transporter n=1 Tax=Pseudomonas kribbensis TaxID=1628086 RepID=A0A4Y8VHP3_9PSED|nr:multidrug effflux MFS transporter [Pseudomonas kribbensis]TFH79884.1 Bcr/CflA family efflux MFS transporter [Pseudomonas kribbensis]